MEIARLVVGIVVVVVVVPVVLSLFLLLLLLLLLFSQDWVYYDRNSFHWKFQ